MGWARVSLSEPTLIMTTVPMRGIIVSDYISFTPCLSHSGPRDPFTPWSALCIPVYWCAYMCGLQLHALNWTARGRHEPLMSAVKIIDDTWYNSAFSLLRQSDWRCRQQMGSLYCCFVTLHINIGMTLKYYSACVFVDVEPYRQKCRDITGTAGYLAIFTI